MTTKETCPDCGVDLDQPYKKDCEIQPCSVCDGQRITCKCNGHDPTQTVWTGESPLQRLSQKTSSWKLLETEGFVIYGRDGSTQTPPVDAPQPPAPIYSDDFLTRHSRRLYRTFMIEEIYKNGTFTHTYRAVRKRKDKMYDIAIFPTLDEAVEWGKGSAPGSFVL